jgi:hypothetical protein
VAWKTGADRTLGQLQAGVAKRKISDKTANAYDFERPRDPSLAFLMTAWRAMAQALHIGITGA